MIHDDSIFVPKARFSSFWGHWLFLSQVHKLFDGFNRCHGKVSWRGSCLQRYINCDVTFSAVDHRVCLGRIPFLIFFFISFDQKGLVHPFETRDRFSLAGIFQALENKNRKLRAQGQGWSWDEAVKPSLLSRGSRVWACLGLSLMWSLCASWVRAGGCARMGSSCLCASLHVVAVSLQNASLYVLAPTALVAVGSSVVSLCVSV